MAEGVFIFLYPLVFLTSLAGYVPQIFNLIHVKTAASSMALSSWFIWLAASLISLGYGITSLHDMMFCLVAGMNAAAQIVVILLVLYRRDQLAFIFGRQILSEVPANYIQAAPAE